MLDFCRPEERGKCVIVKTLLLTGCFDVLHLGHVRIIQFANSLCERLVIAIDSDEKVKIEKGSLRPFNNQKDRKEFLVNVKGVDEVRIFDSKEMLERICKEVAPDYRLVGSDWKGKKIVGEEYCKEIVYYDRIPGYSTTNILEKKE